MPRTVELSWAEVFHLVQENLLPVVKRNQSLRYLYGIPRGGCNVALALIWVARDAFAHALRIADFPDDADLFVDDIIDSGATRNLYMGKYKKPFVVMINEKQRGVWYKFPWEGNEAGPEENIRRTLEFIGEDPKREGLIDTPSRVVKSYKELYSGYGIKPESVLKTFEDGACQGMVILRDIEFYSQCEHHMQPFFGKAHIGYLPKGKVVGVSKLARLLDVFARRLQIQERIGDQVTDALMTHLEPLGAACVIEAKHLCMTCRGVNKQHSVMTTASLRGQLMEDDRARAEFYRLIGK